MQRFRQLLNSLKNTRENGFTIVEIMVVIAVIAIMGTIATISYMGYRNRSTASDCEENRRGIVKTYEYVYSVYRDRTFESFYNNRLTDTYDISSLDVDFRGCPNDGEYEIDGNTIFCSIHDTDGRLSANVLEFVAIPNDEPEDAFDEDDALKDSDLETIPVFDDES